MADESMCHCHWAIPFLCDPCVYFAVIFRFVLLSFGDMSGYKVNLVLKPCVIPTVIVNNSRYDKPVKITMAENKNPWKQVMIEPVIVPHTRYGS